ncbi:hypothetical protein GOV10_05525 [Candidatus Woesearchaeota archaeon]|nr:hypothetical protein [Candidatus Woesearchaeota archaeon]
MKISELKEKNSVPFLRAQIMSKKPTIESQQGKVCDAVIQDNTGEVTLTLWKEQTEEFAEGDVVVIQNGWCKEFKGVKQISSGSRGTIVKEE